MAESKTLSPTQKQELKNKLETQLKEWRKPPLSPLERDDCMSENDMVARLTEFRTEASLYQKSTKQLNEIQSALRRFENGSYGMCAECEEEIPVKRLFAIPTAIFCIRCQCLYGS